MVSETDRAVTPPARLRALLSWQASKVTTLGARLTGKHMPLTGRADFAVLAALEEFGELSQADLGRRLGLDRNDVNAIMTRLEAERHITRRVDPENRRRKIVTITAAGHASLDQLQRHADAVQDDLLAGLSPADRRQLHALLDKLLAAHPSQPA
jgi:DNA-binding MarR family transcriptional regulator